MKSCGTELWNQDWSWGKKCRILQREIPYLFFLNLHNTFKRFKKRFSDMMDVNHLKVLLSFILVQILKIL